MLLASASERRISMGAPLPTKLAIAGSGSGSQIKLLERRVHAVAQVLRGVDQRAVEIEDQQLEPLHRNGAKHLDHVSSLSRDRPE